MRFILVLALLGISFEVAAESWFGYCIVERNRQRICNEAQPRRGDFTPVCDSFAREEGALAWRARFSTNLDSLRTSMADYCDVVRDGSEKAMFACQLATFCPDDEKSDIKHLASRVYAENADNAVISCLEKEEWKYLKELKEQSVKNCFVRVAAEALSLR